MFLFTYIYLLTSALTLPHISLQTEPDRIYVGELQEKWKLPSDHLPIGIFLDDTKDQTLLISWNVLNSAYIKLIYENSQGLSRSALTRDDFAIKENGLTLREQLVIQSLLKMIQLPNGSSRLICLQECSELFIQELRSQLPSYINVIRSSETAVKNQNILLYDATVFALVEKTLQQQVFSRDPQRPLMEIVLEKQSVRYRIFNAHLRCDSPNPQSFDLANFIHDRKQNEEITILLGDLNMDQKFMIQALEEVAAQHNEKNGFLPFSPYKTSVSPELQSKAIDHIFLDPGIQTFTIREADANELLEEMEQIVRLLERASE